LQGLTASFADPKKGSPDKAVSKLQAALIEATPKITAYLNQLITKAPS
jgi:phage gp36-like protein